MNYILNYEDLQVGDIILQSGHKLHSKAIKKYTKSNFSHAMICVTNMSIVHAEKEGIFSLNPQRLLVENITDLKVLRLKKELKDKDLKNLEYFLRDKIGSVYSVKEAISVIKNNRTDDDYNKFQFCSRLVAQAYEYINCQIVDNVNFCSPADIENSTLFREVENIIRKSEKKDIDFALTPNVIKENQKSMYDWLNKTRDLAYERYKFNISKINDVDMFLHKYPSEDITVSNYMINSGYLENYKIEVSNNLHMHDKELFISKFIDPDNIMFAIYQEFKIIPEPTERHITNYINAKENYQNTFFEFYKIQMNLYKALLSVSMSKYITLYEVYLELFRTGIKDEGDIIIYLQYHLEKLKEMEIEKYNKT